MFAIYAVHAASAMSANCARNLAADSAAAIASREAANASAAAAWASANAASMKSTDRAALAALDRTKSRLRSRDRDRDGRDRDRGCTKCAGGAMDGGFGCDGRDAAEARRSRCWGFDIAKNKTKVCDTDAGAIKTYNIQGQSSRAKFVYNQHIPRYRQCRAKKSGQDVARPFKAIDRIAAR